VKCSSERKKKRERWQISSLMRDEVKLNGKWIEKKSIVSSSHSFSLWFFLYTWSLSHHTLLPLLDPSLPIEQCPLKLSLTTRALTSNIIWCLKVAMALWNPNSYSSSTDPFGRTFARTGGAGCVVSSVWRLSAVGIGGTCMSAGMRGIFPSSLIRFNMRSTFLRQNRIAEQKRAEQGWAEEYTEAKKKKRD
jgi:hypothetical protein